jgi:hypothetical protein
MKRLSLYKLDYSDSLLSAFDISGSLLLSETLWQSKDIGHDMNQLMKDLDILEEDYRNAYENIAQSEAI